MSRCFPFPPPGYDLKPRPDDVNLIRKDKQKHKKHKEKKDKDKKDRKERKENKENGRSVDNHKDDKKRKRKEHREKKDKNKDEQNGEKKNVGSLVNPVDGIHDKREVVELSNRVRSSDGATGNHMVQKITVVDKEKVLENCNGMLAANVQCLTTDSRSLGNGLFKVEGIPCHMDMVEKRKEGKETNGHRNNAVEEDGGKNGDKNNIMIAEYKNKEKTKKEMGFSKDKFTKQETSDRNIPDFHSNQDCQAKLPKLELNGFIHANGVRSDNMSRPVNVSHQAREIGSGVRPSQNTFNLGVGRSVVADEKVNVKLSSPQSVFDNVRNIGPCQISNNAKKGTGMVSINNLVVSNSVTSPHTIHNGRKMEPCQVNNSVAAVKKSANPSADRKFPSSHSFVENGVKMAMQAPDVVHKMMHNKELRMNRPLEGKTNSSSVLTVNPSAYGKFPSSHSFVENGVKMARHAPDVVHKTMHNKELRTNSSLEGKNSSASMLPSASLKRKEKVATTMKPPHPDLKYLSKILTVPEPVDLPPCDDQEWLFGLKDSQTRRPKLASPEIQPTKEVWSEAVILESTGTIALPYVIPY